MKIFKELNLLNGFKNGDLWKSSKQNLLKIFEIENLFKNLYNKNLFRIFEIKDLLKNLWKQNLLNSFENEDLFKKNL